jgi:hypothetical protein
MVHCRNVPSAYGQSSMGSSRSSKGLLQGLASSLSHRYPSFEILLAAYEHNFCYGNGISSVNEEPVYIDPLARSTRLCRCYALYQYTESSNGLVV